MRFSYRVSSRMIKRVIIWQTMHSLPLIITEIIYFYRRCLEMQNTNFLDCSRWFLHTTDSFASRGFYLICISLPFLSKIFFYLRLDDGYLSQDVGFWEHISHHRTVTRLHVKYPLISKNKMQTHCTQLSILAQWQSLSRFILLFV